MFEDRVVEKTIGWVANINVLSIQFSACSTQQIRFVAIEKFYNAIKYEFRNQIGFTYVMIDFYIVVVVVINGLNFTLHLSVEVILIKWLLFLASGHTNEDATTTTYWNEISSVQEQNKYSAEPKR